MSNQFSIQLGLTEKQKEQIVPILKDEVKKLQALQKDKSLEGLKKIERLREIGASFDTRIKPLLDSEQQQKFQDVREAMRKRIVEDMLSEAEKKLQREFQLPGHAG